MWALLVFKNNINISIYCVRLEMKRRKDKNLIRDWVLNKNVSGTVQPSLLLVQIMESVCTPGLLYRACRHYVFVCDCAPQFQYAAQGAPVMLIAPKVRSWAGLCWVCIPECVCLRSSLLEWHVLIKPNLISRKCQAQTGSSMACWFWCSHSLCECEQV